MAVVAEVAVRTWPVVGAADAAIATIPLAVLRFAAVRLAASDKFEDAICRPPTR